MASISSILEYVSGACSGTAHAADSIDDHSVALGMGHYVGILQIDGGSGTGSMQTTLRGHTARVNCVRAASDSLFVSGAGDGTARVWERSAGAWRCTGVLGTTSEAGGSVVGVAAVERRGEAVVVTASTDGCVRVWRHVCGQDTVAEQSQAMQELRGARGCTLAVAMVDLGDAVLLATGGTDGRVRMYAAPRTGDSDGALRFGAAVELAGHDDWVTDVDFRTVSQGAAGATSHWRAGDVALASASQDRHVRVWLISQPTSAPEAEAEALALSTHAHVLPTSPQRSVALDGVLAAHDGWVHSARWTDQGQLATASADGSAMVWAAQDVWTPVARLGGRGALLGCVARGTWLLAHGLTGTLHLWQRGSTWAPRAAVSGHWAAVRDVCWHPSGLGVLTAGADQTARLFAKTLSEGWREVARPQVHGYGVRAAAFVGHAAYVSAGEEKVARVFGATRRFADAWAALVGQPLPDSAQLVAGASQPVLGLSNKALGDGAVEAPANDTYSVRQAHTDVHAARASAAGDVPLEEQLAGATLWAETDKLYAHAYELHTLAAGTTGRWAATACRATDARHANVLVYHVPAHPSAPWPAPQPLDGHALTVTRVRFAHGDTRLLTVGRDRMWNVYERGDEGFRRVAKQARAHARVIWDAAWAPGARVFATASRDRSVRLWHVDAASDIVAAPAAPVVLAFPDAVTAVDFVPHEVNGRWVLAAALECGRVFVLSARAQDEGVPTEWVPQELPPECAHVAAVNRLAWCPHGDADAWLLASVSDDHTLRISRITMHF